MKKVTIIIGLIVCCMCYSFSTPNRVPEQYDCTSESDEEFTPENLKNYIIEKQIKHPHIVYAQALLESGWFKSTIFIENNNLFGMKYIGLNTKVRETTALGEKYNHAVYAHWKHSVDDYLLWQKMFKRTPTKTEEDYFKLLQKKYAEASNYVVCLKKIIKENNL